MLVLELEGHEVEAEELVGVDEVVGGEEDGCFGAGTGTELADIVDYCKGGTDSSANIFLATSGSITGAAGFAPIKPPRPSMPKADASDHPSGRSFWTATYFVRNREQVAPVDVIIFCIAASFTKSSSRNLYGFWNSNLL